ncbi:topoisomerase II-associated protein PAT1 [Xylaria bambusicola]|uniref:topoisomerase II-associated protein PAT1 n=1 Tax=Xylaria bambusicola TaxID=326684 RepID=UPI0020079C99|nr:topoisomerase II-associated protein PAT1 [Xylaria bambusicola]KAI0514758.1 topoisomerase II-associated protein PAT1 [Xylaria bambusicola]
MSNMGSTAHNQSAPGFGQAYDPFADLGGDHDATDEALDFEDTYDGLGDQLDETDDAFNDDTFGDTGADGSVGKDFDFFGATAKITNAMEEEHQRFSLHQQTSRAPRTQARQDYNTGYAYQPAPPASKPSRTGYEKYKEEPTELQIDASIWGVAPKKPVTPAAMSQPPPGRKMMSLEEVEAAMRAGAKQTTPVPPVSQPQSQPQLQYHAQEIQTAAEPAVYSHQPALDPIRQPINGRHQRGFQSSEFQQPAPGVTHGHPITILQRPPRQSPSAPAPPLPNPISQTQQASSIAPTQILQNPNRLSADSGRVPVPMHPSHKAQNSIPRGLPQPQLSDLSEREKAAFVEAEARRAKRNHKIHLMSGNNGLMTPQDKSFITRIQLQQLVSATGDPSEQGNEAALAEDFYYQVLSSLRAGQRPNPNQPLNNFAQTYLFQTGTRRGGPRQHGPQNHVQRMEQQVQRAVEAAKNKPKNKQLVIEGSLGKISFSNAKTPKPLLNIKRTESAPDTNRPASSQRTQHPSKGHEKKDTLRDIENVYLTLMKMEDLTRSMPPSTGPTDQSIADKQDEFNQLNDQLWNYLRVHEPISSTSVHPFISFISYPKGKRAVPRVFRYLTHTQRTTILTMIVIHLDQLDVVRGAQVQTGEPISLDAATRERIELFSLAVMPSLFQLLNESDLDIVTGVLGLITQNLNVDLVARTRIGVSMLTMILSRAELIKQAGQANEQSWQQWVATFNLFFNTLEPTLHNIFPGTVTSGEDIYVWQFLAAIGIGASPDEQQRLVFAVKDRVMGTVGLAKTLPPDMAKERLDNVNLFMRSIGLDVELLN